MFKQIGQPVPTGAAASLVGPASSSGSATSTAGGSKATITSATVKTTTKNGIASLVTSLIGDVTGKSDANSVRPMPYDTTLLKALGMTMAAGGAIGFALVARLF